MKIRFCNLFKQQFPQCQNNALVLMSEHNGETLDWSESQDYGVSWQYPHYSSHPIVKIRNQEFNTRIGFIMWSIKEPDEREVATSRFLCFSIYLVGFNLGENLYQLSLATLSTCQSLGYTCYLDLLELIFHIVWWIWQYTSAMLRDCGHVLSLLNTWIIYSGVATRATEVMKISLSLMVLIILSYYQ